MPEEDMHSAATPGTTGEVLPPEVAPREEEPSEGTTSTKRDTPRTTKDAPRQLPKIAKVGTIPLEVFHQMDRENPPEVEEITMCCEGEDVPLQRVEEYMDTSPALTYSTRVRFTLRKRTPPVEAKVRIAKGEVENSTSEEELQEVACMTPPRRRNKRKGGLFLRINKMEIGPKNLEVYRVTENSAVGPAPPTPMTPPVQLYPQDPKGMENED